MNTGVSIPKDSPFEVTLSFHKTPEQLKLFRLCLAGDQMAIDALGAFIAPVIIERVREQNWIYKA